jgi:L-threonylcarbamoyladenylate synthase
MYTLVYEFRLTHRGGAESPETILNRRDAENAEIQARVGETAGLLQGGALAILPTDTVYGICADVRRNDAVRAIYIAKGKGYDAPLQLLFAAELSLLGPYATLTPHAARLLEGLGPGAWTIITAAAAGWDSPALAGGRTVGFRMPDAPVIVQLIAQLGAPVAASSANRHGQPSPTTCAEAVEQVGEFAAIAVDAGPTPEGIDSTVIDCSTDEIRILREGAIDRHTVARILGLSDIPVLRSVRQ